MNIAGSFLLITFLSLAANADDFQPDESVVYKTVGDKELQLDLFKPSGHQPSDSRPAIIFFHGGGWKGGTPKQFYPQSRHLASQGMVAISAEYRLTKQEGVTPQECLKDAKSAIRWVRQHAAELGLDPNRLAAGGGSAGGHLAAAAANTQGFEEEDEDLSVSSRPNALVLYNPVFDNGPKGYGHERVQEYWEEFSPMHNINENSPPTIVLIGTKDHLIPVETVRDYERRMQEAGRRCDIELYQDQGHGFFNFKNPENYQATVKAMDAFLASLGYLPQSEQD